MDSTTSGCYLCCLQERERGPSAMEFVTVHIKVLYHPKETDKIHWGVNKTPKDIRPLWVALAGQLCTVSLYSLYCVSFLKLYLDSCFLLHYKRHGIKKMKSGFNFKSLTIQEIQNMNININWHDGRYNNHLLPFNSLIIHIQSWTAAQKYIYRTWWKWIQSIKIGKRNLWQGIRQ